MRKSILLNIASFINLIYYAVTALILVLSVLASCAVSAGLITFAINWFVPMNPDQVVICIYIAFIVCMWGVIYVTDR